MATTEESHAIGEISKPPCTRARRLRRTSAEKLPCRPRRSLGAAETGDVSHAAPTSPHVSTNTSITNILRMRPSLCVNLW